ncbi:hypothetical protein AMECASPLE_032136 [Ameca splendens]|uniref:Uncharacterized protein n=1 Tax=Ameca splendens TaxID=208324 RepID=A0ABV0ZRD4_9TELE
MSSTSGRAVICHHRLEDMKIPFSHPFIFDGSFHTSLHAPLEAQWIPVCHTVCQTDFYLLRSLQLMESLLLPISELAE